MDIENDKSLQENVILVDSNDKEVGLATKLEAHKHGLLHRAISVFVIDTNGDWLIQQRAAHKYHSASLWSNSCCTHPFPEESIEDAAVRRLQEEMGITARVHKLFDFVYHEPLENNLIEHEFDHVFISFTNLDPVINPNEVSEWKRISFANLSKDIKLRPDDYSVWFRKIYQRVNDFVREYKQSKSAVA